MIKTVEFPVKKKILTLRDADLESMDVELHSTVLQKAAGCLDFCTPGSNGKFLKGLTRNGGQTS